MIKAKIIEIGSWDAFFAERFSLMGKMVLMTESLTDQILPDSEWMAGNFVFLEDAHPYMKAGDKITFARVKLEFLNN